MSFFIKAEINGIQPYIFNIQSKGAAKALKARSFLIDAVGELIRENLLSNFSGSNEYFTGGGNVFVEVPDESWDETAFKRITQEMARQLLSHQLLVSFAYKQFAGDKSFGEFVSDLGFELNQKKLRFGFTDQSVFEPKPTFKINQQDFIEFTGNYARSTGFELAASSTPTSEILHGNRVCLNNLEIKLLKNTKQELLPLPLWTGKLLDIRENALKKSAISNLEPGSESPQIGNIISFEELAGFAKLRTGTDLLGVLKMDVDNLGKIFQQLSDRIDCSLLSKQIKTFFRDSMLDLLNSPFEDVGNGVRYRDNIYTVFAGGDDCFFIGAWDAIIDFGVKLQKSFSAFESETIRGQLKKLTQPITLSASITLVDSHYPVVRFAELAEDSLAKAKGNKSLARDASGDQMKSSICFMGHVFSWHEFDELVAVKDNLNAMVNEDNEGKAFLQRIILSFENSDTVYWHRCEPAKPFNPAILWRFLYSFRDIQKKEYFKEKYYDLFFSRASGYYKKYVWLQFSQGKEFSKILPVAARWTEFMNRSKSD